MTATAYQYAHVEPLDRTEWLASPAYSTAEFRLAVNSTTNPSVSVSDRWKREVRREILDLMGNDARACIDSSTAKYAIALLELLPIETPKPDVVAEDDGEIAFDWDIESRRTFSVSIGRDGTLRYGGLFGHKTRYGSVQLTSSVPNEIVSHVADVTKRR